MITHIRTKGFKGFDLDEPVPQKVIYVGPNKKGKSTRADGIALALYGYIPFLDIGTKPGAILESFGGEVIGAAVKIGDKEFGHKISRNAKGVVSKSVQIDKKKSSKDNFAILLDKAGAPKMVDVATFMKQSDDKKIDTLFDLFPNPELSEIDSEIETAKADISRIKAKKDGAESTVQRLVNSKQAIELPSGSIAEVQNEINKIEIQIAELARQIKQAEIEEAEIKAKAEGEQQERERAENEKREQEEKAEALQAERFPSNAELDAMPDSPQMQEIDQIITGMENQVAKFRGDDWNEEKPVEISEPFHPDLSDKKFFQSPGQRSIAADSIQRIIDALNGAGCNTCAALIVAKMELKKIHEQNRICK